jgi:hypothetical protein
MRLLSECRGGVTVYTHTARAAGEAARCGAQHRARHFLDEAAAAAMSSAGTLLVPTLSCTQADPGLLRSGTCVSSRHPILGIIRTLSGQLLRHLA